MGDKLGPALDVAIERTDKLLDSFEAFARSESFAAFVEDFTAGLSLLSGASSDKLAGQLQEQAAAIGDLRTEAQKLIATSTEFSPTVPMRQFDLYFAQWVVYQQTAGQVGDRLKERVEEINVELAKESESAAEFQQKLQEIYGDAVFMREDGWATIYGDNYSVAVDIAGMYQTVQDEAKAAADEVQRLAVASASNTFELSDRELLGAGYAEERGYRVLADDLTAVGETAEEAEARLEAVAAEIERYEASYRSALGESSSYTTELFAAQEALIESQGEWVDTSRDNSWRIGQISSQLATDLTDEQTKAYREILNTAVEGGAEWQAAWHALQSDLTSTQRQELVAQLGDLQATHGDMVNVYTGDAEAAEEAQARILAAQEAIRESYRQTAFEGMVAQASLDQLPLVLEWAEQQGIIAEGEAEVRLQFAETMAAIESTTAALADGQPINADYLESITLLTSGLLDNEEQAQELAGVMSADMVQSFMDASAGGGTLIDILRGIGLKIDEIPPSVTVAFVSDTSRWNPPGEGTGWSTNPNDDPTKPTAMADGGRVMGGIPGRDSVRALMMPGEYVLRASVAQNIGYDTLDAINHGATMGMGGGRVNNVGGDTFNIQTTSNSQARLVATMVEQRKKARLASVMGF